jgi:hypothetical protein
MKHANLFARKTREFERIDQAWIAAKARLKALEARNSTPLELKQAQDQVTKLASERQQLRLDLESLEASAEE